MRRFSRIAVVTMLFMVFLMGWGTACNNGTDPIDEDPVVPSTPTNKLPVANAGTDFEHNISDSGTTITLSGGGTDEDGTIASYAWTCTSRPTGADMPAFNDSTAQNPQVSGFNRLGEYTFTLKVTDNEGAESAGAVVKVTLAKNASTFFDIAPISFSPAPVTELNFTPSYTGITNPDFSSADISNILTYTLKVINFEQDYINTWNSADGFDGRIPTDTHIHYQTDLAGFTQRFFYNGNLVGVRAIAAMVADDEFFFGQSYSIIGNIDDIPGITVSRKVTSGSM